MRVQPNVQYGERDGVPLRLDLFHPGQGELAPVVLMIHGGGWISGTKNDYHDEASWLCEQGFAVAVPEYRLAPLYPFPAAIADIQLATSFLRNESKRLEIDSERVGAIGNSAGGHLAAMTGLCTKPFNHEVEVAPVQAVVNICGLADIRNPRETNFDIAIPFIEQFMSCGYEGNEQAYADASPVTYVCPEVAPILIIHGSDDDVVKPEVSAQLHEALSECGAESYFYEMPGEAHSFSFDGWMKVRELYLDFLSKKLGVS